MPLGWGVPRKDLRVSPEHSGRLVQHQTMH